MKNAMPGYYHLSIKMLGRSEGRSAVACAAYRSGQALHDERYDKLHNYTPRGGILCAQILAPEGAPEWATDRQQLWNRVEAAEARKDAQLAREFTMALPHQVSDQEKIALVETFIQEQLIPRGMIVDYAIHAPNGEGDQRNWHAHLMTTLRPLEEGELARKKDRQSCARPMVEQWRAAWGELQNEAFARLQILDEHGDILRVDHRSYEAQGVDKEPTYHMGVHATAMERGGKLTDIGQQNRAILAANDNKHTALEDEMSRLINAERMKRERSAGRDFAL